MANMATPMPLTNISCAEPSHTLTAAVMPMMAMKPPMNFLVFILYCNKFDFNKKGVDGFKNSHETLWKNQIKSHKNRINNELQNIVLRPRPTLTDRHGYVRLNTILWKCVIVIEFAAPSGVEPPNVWA